MNPDTLCRSMLALVDAIPSDVHWHVVPTDHRGWLFVADGRDDASTIEMAAIAGEFGEVIAEQCFHSRRDARPIIGCIVQLAKNADVDEIGDRLRGSYQLSTDRVADEETGEGPF